MNTRRQYLSWALGLCPALPLWAKTLDPEQEEQIKRAQAVMAELEHAVSDTLLRKKGNVIIPAFAVGRTQEMLRKEGNVRSDEGEPEM